jgi:hypothetical protein
MDPALPFIQMHMRFFRLDDIWVRSEIKYWSFDGSICSRALRNPAKSAQTEISTHAVLSTLIANKEMARC